MPWLQYSAKNAPQLDPEIEEVRQLVRWQPTPENLAEERDRWLFQLFSGRRYEDLEKFDKRERITLSLPDVAKRLRCFTRREKRAMTRPYRCRPLR